MNKNDFSSHLRVRRLNAQLRYEVCKSVISIRLRKQFESLREWVKSKYQEGQASDRSLLLMVLGKLERVDLKHMVEHVIYHLHNSTKHVTQSLVPSQFDGYWIVFIDLIKHEVNNVEVEKILNAFYWKYCQAMSEWEQKKLFHVELATYFALLQSHESVQTQSVSRLLGEPVQTQSVSRLLGEQVQFHDLLKL